MKKRTHTLLYLVLVVVLTASMVVPAMAEQPKNTRESGTGTAGSSYDYAWELTYTTTDSTASIRTTRIDTTVQASVSSYVFYDLTGDYGYTDEVKLTNYRNVTVSAGYIFDLPNGTPVRGEVKGAVAQFWVGGSLEQTIFAGARDYDKADDFLDQEY